MTAVFFRLDDVGALTPSLRELSELFTREQVAVNYHIIPSNLTAETAEYLGGLRAAHPGLVGLNQHGYRHEYRNEQTADGTRVLAEFAGGRSYEDQRADIARGREILSGLLGDDLDEMVFCPPSHAYDVETVRALNTLGFRVLSSGVYPWLRAWLFYLVARRTARIQWLGHNVSYHSRGVPGTSLVEISVAMSADITEPWASDPQTKTTMDLLGEFHQCRTRLQTVGIMLHPQTFDDEQKVATLSRFIAALKREPDLHFTTIESIYEGIARGEPAV